MPGFRPLGLASDVTGREIMPGDTLLGGEAKADVTTVGAGTWPAAAIVGGILRRTGPVAGYADTTDTADNIIAALAGNGPAANVVPGSSWHFTFINTVAFAMTLTLGTGVQTGFGTINCALSLVREYLVTVINATRQSSQNCTTTNGSTTINFVLPAGMSSLPIGPAANAVNITPGQLVTGTGIAANTKVAQLIYGVGGVTGVVLDTAATATNAVGTSITFSPVVQLDGIRSSTL